MHSPVLIAHCGQIAFGAAEQINEHPSPRLHKAAARFLRQHLRATEHRTRCDLETPGKLLISLEKQQRSLGQDHVRLPGIQALDEGGCVRGGVTKRHTSPPEERLAIIPTTEATICEQLSCIAFHMRISVGCSRCFTILCRNAAAGAPSTPR